MTNPDKIRLDKWLWAARFYKTRSLAADAVKGGKVQLNHIRTKPSKELQCGSLVSIKKSGITWEVHVIGISGRRGPVVEAQKLYEETEQSIQERAKNKECRIDQALIKDSTKGRPTKRDRRRISNLMGR